MSSLEEALEVSALGRITSLALPFRIFPIRVGDKQPAKLRWPQVASSDPDQISEWWSEANYNVGIRTGRYGDQFLFVFDVDVKNEAKGKESLAALEAEGKIIPPTLAVDTPSGGLHYYMLAKFNVGNRIGLFQGIDIKCEGGYVVGPSSTVEGKQYKCRTSSK